MAAMFLLHMPMHQRPSEEHVVTQCALLGYMATWAYCKSDQKLGPIQCSQSSHYEDSSQIFYLAAPDARSR